MIDAHITSADGLAQKHSGGKALSWRDTQMITPMVIIYFSILHARHALGIHFFTRKLRNQGN
jgi:hypothetical protein